MIQSFACTETEQIWNGKRSRKLPADIQSRALAKLNMIDAADTLDDLKLPPVTACTSWTVTAPVSIPFPST